MLGWWLVVGEVILGVVAVVKIVRATGVCEEGCERGKLGKRGTMLCCEVLLVRLEVLLVRLEVLLVRLGVLGRMGVVEFKLVWSKLVSSSLSSHTMLSAVQLSVSVWCGVA